jgi:hypothetical protein
MVWDSFLVGLIWCLAGCASSQQPQPAAPLNDAGLTKIAYGNKRVVLVAGRDPNELVFTSVVQSGVKYSIADATAKPAPKDSLATLSQCTSGSDFKLVIQVAPKHGKVTLERADITDPNCPQRVLGHIVTYISDPGFIGKDGFVASLTSVKLNEPTRLVVSLDVRKALDIK